LQNWSTQETIIVALILLVTGIYLVRAYTVHGAREHDTWEESIRRSQHRLEEGAIVAILILLLTFFAGMVD